MTRKSSLARILSGFVCLFLGIALCGVNYCQRSYSFMEQVTLANSPTPTSESTETPDGTVTATSTPEEDEEEETPTPTAVATSTATVEVAASQKDAHYGSSAVLSSLSELSRMTPVPGESARAVSGRAAGSASNAGNWLGQIGKSGTQSLDDTDKDGYTDWLEIQRGSDPLEAAVTPELVFSSNLESRIAALDKDMDGLSDSEERRLGTNPLNSDSDGDGVSDGAEVSSGSKPLDAGELPADTDKDGLSDVFERRIGTSPYRADSDLDGASDSVEVAVGSDPLNVDTDQDGVYDGREVALGADPALQDFHRAE